MENKCKFNELMTIRHIIISSFKILIYNECYIHISYRLCAKISKYLKTPKQKSQKLCKS